MDIPVLVDEYGLARASYNHDQVVLPSIDHRHHLIHQEDHHHHLIHQEDHHHDQYDHTQLVDLRKGPWTVEEDTLLYNYVSVHGEGRWNSLARHAGLKRTGKSCRLRWLNYLRPSVRRGNITLQEQLLILELHSRWGNRWSKIAQYLPGRTDNEIKNYWRTRVQKQAKQLKCDVNSKQFQDAMRHVWIPRLIERIHSTGPEPKPELTTTSTWSSSNWAAAVPDSNSPDTSDAPASSVVSELTDCGHNPTRGKDIGSGLESDDGQGCGNWLSGGDSLENWWSEEDISFLQQHLFD